MLGTFIYLFIFWVLEFHVGYKFVPEEHVTCSMQTETQRHGSGPHCHFGLYIVLIQTPI